MAHRAVLLMCAALVGCGKLFGTVVDQPRAVAENTLYNMRQDANLMDMPLGLSGTTQTIARGGDGVVWTYSRWGKPVCTFTAHVSEESADTSLVWTGVETLVDETDNSYLCAAVDLIGRESVAATLENRSADELGTQQRIASLAPAHVKSIFSEISQDLQRSKAQFDEGRNCARLRTSADQADCNGTHGLRDPTDRRD